ncbi:alpha/beta hydrolase family protein [Zavarzinella formosa]|uniref:alpha/beta hydrolase family protein n=1 Tax=Zavarzinella formosa TaxID=360055 RepID=UPI000319893C|nr:alpha/beta fold hydrolase [Zavarzinella formosa]
MTITFRILLVGLFIAGCFDQRTFADEPKPATKKELLTYASSIDDTKPLLADVEYIPDGKKKPLLVVMHGYRGSRKAVALDVKELAPRGVFAIAPDMRGCGDSGGKWDSGGLDVHDILDAVLAAMKKYPQEIDVKNLNIVGYSGGGGNAIACMVRFPDLFRNYISFFGISDYGGWHASKGRVDCNEWMEKALGGPPAKLPELYESRNAIPAAANVGPGKLHFVWDEKETMCPANMIEEFIINCKNAGKKEIVTNVSKATDQVRWVHNYRTGNRDLTKADELFLPDVLSRPAETPLRLPAKGKLFVPGYVVTRNFQVWVEDGTRGSVTVEYETGPDGPKVTVVSNPKKYKVRIEMTSPLKDLP